MNMRNIPEKIKFIKIPENVLTVKVQISKLHDIPIAYRVTIVYRITIKMALVAFL